MSSIAITRDAAINLSEEFVQKIQNSKKQPVNPHYTVGYLTAVLGNLMTDIPEVSDRVIDYMSFIEEPENHE